ncbi:uncharacterized protein si:dkey-21e13.3 [Dunckerocampus dactyliophorus]|uniref:uncharacterized protein si:dkey-21e13.3 n=1 Tax=Dunckerocampus dactyliophorus TaxID=161453 RepID=UPI0024076C0B|nr:uncharacterized protein si:dkey-21e13.3 [Dunckerocampus dactyliophorus]
MGHPHMLLTFTYPSVHKSSSLQPHAPHATENLNNALGAIRVLGLEMIEDELKPHLCTVLVTIQEGSELLYFVGCMSSSANQPSWCDVTLWLVIYMLLHTQRNRGACMIHTFRCLKFTYQNTLFRSCPDKGAAEQVVISGILPVLAWLLRSRGPLALLTARLVSELAKESVVRKGFGDSGLVVALLSVLTSPDQDLLRHAAQAVARVSYDSSKHQQSLLRKGAVPRLVAVLLRFPGNEVLEEVCLRALCNLSGMGVPEDAGVVWERNESATPGESVFHGVSSHTCGFLSSVTLVRVCHWAPAQHAISIEVVQRCSTSFLNLHANKQATGWFPFTGLWRCSKTPGRNAPRRSSLSTLMFHTFL